MKFIKKHWLIILSIIIILPTIWPLFRSDFFRMHDWTHVARLVELDVALKAGQIPPRWAPDFGWGYGMPLFHYYSPLPYYLAELLYLIKLPAVWAIKAVFALNFIAGFYFMYLWAKTFWGKLGGLLAATGFLYLPYRAVDFYVRGTLGELTAMTFLPLLFYATHRMVNSSKPKFIFLTALSLAGIFLSHSPIALFSIFFISLYFLFHLKSWYKFLFTGLLAFGLSAFFILPAFLEKDFTIVSKIGTGFFHYSFHFIYLRQLFTRYWGYGGSILGLEDNISFQLGWPQVILAALAGLVWLVAFKHNKKAIIAELTYIAIAFSSAVFLMTFHSKLIWDKLTVLQITQFPWRLLTFAATFTAFASGSLAWLITNKKPLSLIVGLLIFLTIGLNFTYFRPEKFSSSETFYYTDRNKIKSETSDALFDYLPVTAIRPEHPSDQLFNFDKLDFTAQGPGDYIVNQYYFPGWQAKIDNQPVKIEPDSQLGRIKIDLPSGEHRVEIKLGKTDIQRWSDIISLFSWLVLLIYLIKHASRSN